MIKTRVIPSFLYVLGKCILTKNFWYARIKYNYFLSEYQKDSYQTYLLNYLKYKMNLWIKKLKVVNDVNWWCNDLIKWIWFYFYVRKLWLKFNKNYANMNIVNCPIAKR